MLQRKKTIYRSVCLSVVVLTTLTVLQRGLTPGQFLKSSQCDLRHARATKLPSDFSSSSGFWSLPRKVSTAAPSKGTPPTWDVTVSNCSANTNLTGQKWFLALEPHFQQFLLYRHCCYFPILMNHPEKCKGGVYLLVVVKSIITQHDRREAIRRTWGRERAAEGGRGAVRTLFLLGTAAKAGERAHYQQLLAYEDRLYGDILQWDFLDSFFNLTLKEVHFLKWLDTFCPQVSFIFKGDDDVYVSPDNLLEFLAHRRPDEDLFVGDVLYRAQPIREKGSKYYIPRTLYSKLLYPPYAGGGGFLVAAGLARRLHRASQSLELFPIDDVFLGMCLQLLQVRPKAHSGFKTFGITQDKSSPMNGEPCVFRSMLVVHRLLPAELLDMWALVHGNLTCARSFQVP